MIESSVDSNRPQDDGFRFSVTPGRTAAFSHVDLSLALTPPLLFKLVEDHTETATARLGLLALGFVVAYAWSAVFARRLWQTPSASQLSFAMLFSLLLPASVGWRRVLAGFSGAKFSAAKPYYHRPW